MFVKSPRCSRNHETYIYSRIDCICVYIYRYIDTHIIDILNVYACNLVSFVTQVAVRRPSSFFVVGRHRPSLSSSVMSRSVRPSSLSIFVRRLPPGCRRATSFVRNCACEPWPFVNNILSVASCGVRSKRQVGGCRVR